jgi:hypothetical protein
MAAGPRYITPARTARKTPLPTVTPLLGVTQPLPGNGCFSDSTFFALSKASYLSNIFKKFSYYIAWGGL